jgi:hypothetical protein
MTKTTNLLARAAMTLFLALLCSAGAWAQDEEPSNDPAIIIWLNDGSKTTVLFSDMPEFTYTDGYVTLQSNNPSTTLSWLIDDLQKLTFGDASTGIRDIKVDGLDILSDNLTVYDLNGRLVKRNVKSLSELPKGVYIVKDGNVTIKVVRK